ncbi:MAG: hypothetical protein KDA84_14575 [Planctomycetaceae bacterium]|nr:hypothetical protein [Planctomycetaceae bacterium]
MGRIKNAKHGPEYKIQAELIDFLEKRGWLVERMIGNAYQQGIPDLYIHHPQHDYRWIDVKRPDGQYTFTKAQKTKWPLWDAFGVGIWILVGADQSEYDKLFAPPNWKSYWKDSWGPIGQQLDIDKLLEGLDEEEA